MKVNFRIESSSFCYVFNKYKIEEIKGKNIYYLKKMLQKELLA